MAAADQLGPCLPEGWRAIIYDTIDSTNAEAMRRAASGARGPLWLTSGHQSAGKGRSGRSWASAGSSLAATLLFQPGCPPADLPQVSLVAGVAAHDAVTQLLPEAARPSVRLKWPNDVLAGGAKLVGILVESTFLGPDLVAMVGIGINITAAPAISGRETTCLAELGSTAGIATAAGTLAQALAAWLDRWDQGRDFAAVRQAWLERAGSLGEAMTVNAGGGLIAGSFAGLGSDGSLQLDVAGEGRRSFAFGDVALGAPTV